MRHHVHHRHHHVGRFMWQATLWVFGIWPLIYVAIGTWLLMKYTGIGLLMLARWTLVKWHEHNAPTEHWADS